MKKIDYKSLAQTYEQIIDKKNIILDVYKNQAKMDETTIEIMMELNKEYREEIFNHKVDKIFLVALSIITLIFLIIK